MIPNVSMSVEGLSETVAQFDHLPQVLVVLGLFKALEAGGKVIQDAVYAKTRIQLRDSGGDLLVEGGELRDALKHVTVVDSQGRGGFVAVGFGRLGYIANWVEYGHKLLTHWENKEAYTYKGRKRVRKWGGHEFIKDVPAYPFMRPALEISAEAAIDAFAASLAETINNLKYKAA